MGWEFLKVLGSNQILIQIIIFLKKSMLLKDSGRLIRLIRDQANQELMNTFQCEVRLKLIVNENRR